MEWRWRWIQPDIRNPLCSGSVSSRLHDYCTSASACGKHQNQIVLPVAAARTYEPAKIVSLARQYLQSSALLFTEKPLLSMGQARVQFEHAYSHRHGDSDISGTFDTETRQVSSIVLSAIPLPDRFISLGALAQVCSIKPHLQRMWFSDNKRSSYIFGASALPSLPGRHNNPSCMGTSCRGRFCRCLLHRREYRR